MSKITSAGIGILILLVLVTGANAIAVENITKLDIAETNLWDVVLSPDGTKLAYIAYDENHTQQVYVINTDGTGEKKLTGDPNKKWELAWGPDRIAYVSYGKDGLEKIFVVDPDGTGNIQLIPDNTRQGNPGFDKPPAWAAPSWSPDGKSLIYTSLDGKEDPKIYKVNSDGTGKVQVFNDSFRQWSPVFSPDGQNIVYVSYPSEKNIEQLFIVDIAGTARRQLTFDAIKPNYQDWGPDGTIVFVSYENVTSSGERLFAIDQDGSNMRLFINGDYKQQSPSFSRDGRKFAYAAIDISGTVKIAVGDLTGIKAIVTPLVTTPATPAPSGKTTVRPTVKETERGGWMEGPIWTGFIVLVIVVLLLLILWQTRDYFKK
ncbi:Protein TolB [uncultured archaeon]|nr:Protein TolB [uncultured archaeon]